LDLFEYLHDLPTLNRKFLKKARPLLIQRNPFALWQGISGILALIIIYLSNELEL
jgi:hypothetical protein